ncbi:MULTISPECIES: ABC transporter permease subunit [unclassified Paenibacillus]|uniref:ABC transporter permease subunit n=1 Tax=unclassified Paenibacillus TaxID=185978 RepID=UPI0009566498|nr:MULTISPECIES: ABC transporter permease subunit [unclassified Paenibacillus]ASS64926.1 ABC transporter permease subunit [Paenibacillus sp. RUD330]SIR01282.1 sulfonate transport system permease protein [Paenibacillus sp. RU4X]SIR33778.1 sulfonate transport system permease protein [Paenibacillus sp. RU4T]
MNRPASSRWRDSILPWTLPVLVLALWQISTSAGWIAERTLPQPLRVADTLGDTIRSGVLLHNLGISAMRAMLGFLIGSGIGFALGLMNGLSKIAEKATDSSIQMIRNIPLFALLPLFIIWFGIGEEIKLALVSLGVFFPVYLNTFHGIRSVDPGLVEMGRVYRMSRRSLYVHIVLPGALPSILVGIRYALGITWLVLIVAETVAADAGIGYMAMNAREFFQLDVIVLSIVIYALLGKLSDSLAKRLEKRFLKWNPTYVPR